MENPDWVLSTGSFAVDTSDEQKGPFICGPSGAECGVLEDLVETPWHNEFVPTDVDRDGVVSPIDVLAIINDINARGSGRIANSPAPDAALDVNDDGVIAPNDVLAVIDELNNQERDTAVTIAQQFLELQALDWQLGRIGQGELTTGKHEFSYWTSEFEFANLGPRMILVDMNTLMPEFVPQF